MNTIRWGIIGCGDVTEVKSGPALQQAQGSQLVAVMRRNGELAEDYARRHGVQRWYDDADALIADPEVNAIYVATPPDSHCEYAMQVCASGKPAYIEKPMARTEAECSRMVEAFSTADQRLFVAYYRRALPRFLMIKKLVDSGSLGIISQVTYHYATQSPSGESLPWRLNAEVAGGGLFFDLGSHALDMLDFLLGPLQHVGGTAGNRGGAYDVEDNVVMHFRSSTGIPGTASWNFASFASEDRLEIVGTEGHVALSIFENEPIKLTTAKGDSEVDIRNPKHIQLPMIQTVVDHLLGRGTCPSTGESALRTSAVMDAVTMEYYGSRGERFWQAPDRWPGRAP